MKPGVDLLRSIRPFGDLDPALLGRLNDTADLVRLGPDDPLFASDTGPNDLFVLLDGLLLQALPAGRGQSLVDVREPVAILGLAEALLDAPRALDARTITAAKLIVIPAHDLRVLVREEPDVAPALLEAALASVRELTEALCNLKSRTAAQRLAAYLLARISEPDALPARLVLPMDKQFIAVKLGCSQENLSRAFASLRRFGVETQRGIVILRDVASLREFAN